jgi:1-acyl-sn-glycerol-3-phosphate acyltransferase
VGVSQTGAREAKEAKTVRRWGRLGFWYRLGIAILVPPARLLTRREHSGAEMVPPGGVVVAANHISLLDPVVLCDFVLYGLGRAPRFLAKSEMFVGRGLVPRVMRGAGQIPVDRHAPDASRALDAAVAALERGDTVVIYPEGTVTKDQDHWPMAARTGVARLALLSGAPVVPVAQWGAQDPQRLLRRLPRRRLVRFRVGPPVDLSRWQGRELTAQVLREATEAVMAAVTAELEVLRGEPRPSHVHDPRGNLRAGAPGLDQQQQEEETA